jgi:hypothetical protein
MPLGEVAPSITSARLNRANLLYASPDDGRTLLGPPFELVVRVSTPGPTASSSRAVASRCEDGVVFAAGDGQSPEDFAAASA